MKLGELRRYKKILILGYGVEGKATEKFLKKFHPEAKIGITDQKDGPGYLKQQKNYDLAIRTPLLRPEKITIPYTTATNIFMENVANMKIGITGTKGKSTTASLLHHILRNTGRPVRLYGNVGIPMLSAMTEGIAMDDIFVLELSSYQLEDIHTSPDIACFLNIYEELHNHNSYEEYFQAKSHITLFQGSEDTFFYNGGEHQIKKLLAQTKAQSLDFSGIDATAFMHNLAFYTHAQNIQAVIAICRHMGLSDMDIKTSIQSFMPLPHRLRNVGVYNDITFIDDSASTHPSSTVFALSVLPRIDTIILGGEDRGYNFSELAQQLARKDVRTIILFPDTQEKLYNCISDIKDYDPHITKVDSMQEAMEEVLKQTGTGDICLLSPGAPSYTMFHNFGERGDTFVEFVKKYAQSQTFAQKKTTSA